MGNDSFLHHTMSGVVLSHPPLTVMATIWGGCLVKHVRGQAWESRYPTRTSILGQDCTHRGAVP